MFYLENGIYYYDLLIPNISGVYDIYSKCYYVSYIDTYTSNSYSIITGTLNGGLLNDTYLSDNSRLLITDATNVVDVGFNFTIGTINSSNYLDLFFEGTLRLSSVNDTGTLSFYAYNYNTLSWDLLENTQTGYSTLTDYTTSNRISNPLDYVSGNNVQIRLYGTGTDINRLRIDLLTLERTTYTSVPNQIVGGGELHVTDRLNTLNNIYQFITNDIWNRLTEIIIGVNETKESISNLSIKVEVQHNETMEALSEINTTDVKVNISQQLNDLRENLTREFESLRQDRMVVVN